MLMLAMQSVFAQDEKSFTAKGVVVDANNEPIIGATVVIQDKPGVGTVTDVDGNFSIKVDMYDNLVISYIGYEQVSHRITKEDESINIVLQEKGADVDEVVVVGMGSQRKVSVAGAITTINPDELVKPATNIVNTLAGRVAGVIGVQSSGEPGKTITINFYDIDKKLYLVDLPGYGYAKRTRSEQAVWSKLTDGYFTNNPNIDSLKLVCQLIDSRTGPTQDDINMIYYLRETNTPYVIVATKSDKLNSTEKKEFMSSLAEDDMTSDSPLIMYSSKNGDGKAELWNQIYAHCSL